MPRRSGAVSVAAGITAGVMVVALFARVLTSPLPADRVLDEIGLAAVSVLYAGIAVALQRRDWSRGAALVVLQGVAPALLFAAIVAVAGAALPDREVLTVLAFTAVTVAIPAEARVAVIAATAAALDAVLAAVWLAAIGGSVPTLLLVIAFIAVLQLTVVAQFRVTLSAAETERMRSTAHGFVAVNVGTAIDLVAVARAVMTTCRETFPLTTEASVLLFDPASGRLRPLPVHLDADGGVATGEEVTAEHSIGPGEGLAGKVYTGNRPMLWPTALDVNMAESNLPEAVRRVSQPYRRGPVLSAIGAPLLVDDEVIGVYLLSSHRQELAWDVDDVPVVAALAAEAARALERARRYERDLDAAHLDSITGLANHRQLQRTLDQEVARARRRSATVGVVFCDLDRFKSVNDVYGHAAGDRVLTILAGVFSESLRREDSAARYGGDEFVCVLPGADREEANAVGQRIASSFEARVRADTELAASGVTISCGIAIFPDDADSPDGLLERADTAMRDVKGAHRGPVGSLRPAR